MLTPRARGDLLALAVLLAAALTMICLLSPRCHSEGLPAPLARLVERLQAPGIPEWKRDLLPDVLARRIGRFEANVTVYCAGHPEVDPPCGGRFAATGVRLRWGHAAVDPSYIPLGSVLLIDGIDQLLLAVDTGGAIRGPDVDVCTPDPAHYYALARRFSHTRATCWVIRRGPR